MRLRTRLFLLIAGFCLIADSAVAQDPFSSLTVSAGGTYDVHRGRLYDAWAPGYGGEVAVSTPFYAGEAEVAVALHRYEVDEGDVPRFDAILTVLGWGLVVSPVEDASWYNGVQIGNYRMAFDEEIFAGVRNESEISLGVHSRLQLHFSPTVHLFVAGRYMRTFTAPRFDTAYMSAGLSVVVDSPGWLKTILR